jgi:hypothetical protein
MKIHTEDGVFISLVVTFKFGEAEGSDELVKLIYVFPGKYVVNNGYLFVFQYFGPDFHDTLIGF